MRYWLGDEGVALVSSHSLTLRLEGNGQVAATVGRILCCRGVQPCTAPPAVGEPLPVKAATELGPYSHLMSLG